ncbi:MAG: diphthine synthase [Candidatus Altiarchaeota archaeon]
MLYLIGLGLYGLDDLTLGGLSCLKKSDRVFLESYTSFHTLNVGEFEALCGRKIEVLGRIGVEDDLVKNIIEPASKGVVSLLVAGDPLVATTHSGIITEAVKRGVCVRIIHASSIVSAVGETGLSVYKFGRITTLNIPEQGYAPTSAYDFILENKKAGLHSLILLDVKADKDKYMSVAEGVSELLRLEAEKKGGLFDEDTKLVGLARLGAQDSIIKYRSISELMEADFGGPPHALILPGKLHFTEEEAINK